MTERGDQPGKILERALEILRELPPVDDGTVSRIVAAAARTRAQDTTPNDDDLLPPAPLPRLRSWLYSTVAAAAIVVAVGGALILQSWRNRETAAPGQRVVPASVSREALEAAPVPTQFVFDGRARRVVLVGDFNNWDEKANPLEREPGSSLWSVTVPIQRGRHIYAFLVDSVWTVDKHAPVASDPDFGVTGSVILVGRP